ncbi:hypothetical protein PP175_13950 [Aneurinibacillus sp. Ricciae_BoGa-3]|uniref:hypothetical protein n=1 Tax=Aneurinibacillus sp. Ricciae_BoGa-3 TaxID=3022697 RepID=UPI00233FA8F7|nr:hypothetical protein [Aneurinibacillus sp. Ricciae_BoGa-3]WCK52541.1 hypothetical protein PP175_13950 [Aneurinibacillus sp. Ricciae_BoGa-3]
MDLIFYNDDLLIEMDRIERQLKKSYLLIDSYQHMYRNGALTQPHYNGCINVVETEKYIQDLREKQEDIIKILNVE